jgi:gas vesicle protein
MIGVPVEQSM